MAHAIDTTDGKSSFVSAHEAAWHMLGETLDHSFTAEEAMAEGLLGGWNVRKSPMFAEVDGNRIEIPGINAVVRDNPVRAGQVDVLSTYGVSDAYQIVQNEEHAAFLNALVDESGAHFDTAGAINGGRQVFITMKLPGHINIGGVDPINNYIAAVNSHDGSMAFTLMTTPVRIVCANTLNCAFQDNSHIIRTRHTSGIRDNLVVRARAALEVSFNYLDGFQEEADRLINTTMTQSQFEAIIEKEFGPADDAPAATATRAMNKVAEIQELFADAQTQDGIRNTAWAGFNALTEWADHMSPSRGTDRETSRAVRAILDPNFKNRALKLMLAHA
jgi:phage/plasmid-like protein (TIGR03299 family)